MKAKKKKIWTYSPFHSFKYKGVKSTMMSQLYEIGIYIIYDDDSDLQSGLNNPTPIVNIEKKLRKACDNKEITDLYFSTPIRVTTDDDGYLIQLKDEEPKG